MAAGDEAGRARLEVMLQLGIAGCAETQQAERGGRVGGGADCGNGSERQIINEAFDNDMLVTSDQPNVLRAGWKVMCPDLPTVIDPYLK